MSTELEFTSALIVRGDCIYIAGSPVALPPHSLFTRLTLHDLQRARPWTKHDVSFWTVALARYQERPDATPKLCALSEEGEVELAGGGKLSTERIPDAGLYGPTSKGYGYVSGIRQVGEHLYVCGGAGQVYKRLGPDQWEHMDDGLLQAPDVEDRLLLRAIGGPAEDDMYVAGDLPGRSGREGRLFHWDGARWRPVELPPVGGINAIHVESAQRVWLAGLKGALLVGDHRAGFMNLSGPRSPQLFHDLTLYNGTVYLGSNHGLFRYDAQRRRVVRERTGLTRELEYVHTVGHADGVLWAVGPKDIARFDGQAWARVDHPDNPARG